MRSNIVFKMEMCNVCYQVLRKIWQTQVANLGSAWLSLANFLNIALPRFQSPPNRLHINSTSSRTRLQYQNFKTSLACHYQDSLIRRENQKILPNSQDRRRAHRLFNSCLLLNNSNELTTDTNCLEIKAKRRQRRKHWELFSIAKYNRTLSKHKVPFNMPILVSYVS